jgi:hypothetical protein
MPKIHELQKAFALATKCAEAPDIPLRERNYFRAIASLIWQSYGQPEPSKGVN